MPHGEEFSNTLLVKVEGTPLPDDVKPLLVQAYVDDSSHVPDMFLLRFNDEAGIAPTKANLTIGAKVELSVQTTQPGGPQVLLLGEVTALEVDISEAGVFTVVRGLDLSHRLFRGTRVEAYLNQTASDIARKIASRAGIPIGTIDATTTVLEHCSQDGVNDWDFLKRLGAEHDRLVTITEGKFCFISQTPAAEAPGGNAGARSNPKVLERGVTLVNLRGTITASGQVPKVEVRGWDPEKKKHVVAEKQAATESAVPEGGVTPVQLAEKFGAPPYVLGRPTLAVQAEVDAVATALADRIAGGFAELDGTARGNPELRAGTAIQLVGVAEPFTGKYVLTSTRHEFSPDFGYRTLFTASNRSERSLFGTTTAATRTQPDVSGVVPAIVTNTKDPKNMGRVKLKFPWLSESYESGWARITQPGAGADRGAAVLPEVNDEVLVAFEQGDFGRPYVLGGLYNGVDKPHGGWAANIDSGSGQVIRRGLVSRTGMKVDFIEKTGSDEKVEISSNDGKQKIHVIQKPTAGIEIVSEGPVKVTAKQDVEVTTASGNVKISGTNVDVEAKGNLNLKGAAVKVAGQATAELSASGATTVKGAVVKIN